MTAISNQLVISLIAQRAFNHHLLLALFEAGAMTQNQAAAVAAQSAEFVRDLEVAPEAEAFRELLARGFEQVAGDILGMPQPHGPTSSDRP